MREIFRESVKFLWGKRLFRRPEAQPRRSPEGIRRAENGGCGRGADGVRRRQGRELRSFGYNFASSRSGIQRNRCLLDEQVNHERKPRVHCAGLVRGGIGVAGARRGQGCYGVRIYGGELLGRRGRCGNRLAGIGRQCGFMVAEGSYLVGSAMQLGGLANYLRDRIPKRGP